MSYRLVEIVFASALAAWLKPYAAACATFAADDGSKVYPTVARIAKMVGRSERATQYALQALRDQGVLTVDVQAGRYRATRYAFRAIALPQVSDAAQLPLFAQAPTRKSRTISTESSSFPQISTGLHSHGCNQLHPMGAMGFTRSVSDPSRTTSTQTRAREEQSQGKYPKTGT